MSQLLRRSVWYSCCINSLPDGSSRQAMSAISTNGQTRVLEGGAPMIRRMSILVVATFLPAALLLAFANATFVLKNGDRASGQLTYKVGSGDLGVTANGKERMFPFDDIALIQFAPG